MGVWMRLFRGQVRFGRMQFESRLDADALLCGCTGTGGTISGIGKYLKSVDPNVQVILCDPEGSGLYNRIKFGVMFDKKESEGTKRRHQVDTVVEGM